MVTRQPRGRGGGRPTLEEVAARAGVGRGTVSRVINGSPRVSAATRAAVEAAVSELGYVPNTAARALAANRADAIALVVPEPETRFFTEPYFSDIIRGVGASLADTSMQLLLTFAGGERERGRLAEYLAAHRVDGVLLVSVHADDPLPDLLRELEIPAVISGRRSADEHLPSVDSDNYAGARAAVDHLLTRGRRTIATISGSLGVYGARLRLDGYRETLSEAGAVWAPAMEATGDFTEEGGRRAMAELLSRVPELDAVFAASDVMAAGARQVLREAGRTVPGDVAMVGFDDSVIARHMDPPLSSVRQPIADMGRAMTELLLAEIARAAEEPPTFLRRPVVEGRQVVLDTELVVRGSS
ncbi:LacI family DNA-binding transcriptional regulator [Streptomyces tsukubensis]|uniref:LacI family transcriptional regulator n=1 Tax=Streptomyces tsukubensis TaxID=83656 RepID=A0A1V4A6M2_9ACTN|nr:LacI family DNA-binding transcriptional regulator [Streptomyces tsukubensis]OON77017.1 LacI family transcriptional regulator [Streptomyces tsukubensis]QFR93743.1 LacI family DNA-binding transcriptional regulator [Streptomyces tsukubensis]